MTSIAHGTKSVWLPDADWRNIQSQVPIPCVDMVPVKRTVEGPSFGLIRRDTPHEGVRWCLVGGRVFLNQSLGTACAYHLVTTLGDSIRIDYPLSAEPLLTSEYFSVRRDGELHDPRQHAIALVFVVSVEGPITACGEAHEFRWFREDWLPASSDFGFGQDCVLRSVIERLKADPRFVKSL